MNTTNEFSFLLKPSAHGVGVFAAHDIKKGARLRFFGDDNPIRLLKERDVPEFFKSFCAHRKDFLICPPDFGYMPVGWYLNHSNEPNAIHDPNEKPGKYGLWLAARDIFAGEEITINYNALEEPKIYKEEYYHNLAMKPLDYYTQQGPRTKVKTGTFKDFPDDVGEICKIIQGLLLYPWHASTLYGVNPSPKRLKERYGKTVQESIDHILKLNKKPLTEYREPAERVLNICRHFAMFMCSVLREKGIPARCRCGFATYFRNAWFDDHRICEYWNAKEKRWCRIDAQMGEIHILKYKINRKTINFADLPKDIFFPGGVAWKLYRMGAVSGNFFGYDLEEGEFGERYIRGNMLRDFFALNNMEYSYQEESKLMDRNYTPTKAELLLLDTIADLTIHVDERFDELLKFCKEHKELRP